MHDSFRFTTVGLAPSFGFGDRTGLATPGHAEAMKQAGGDIVPIFAQQSIREMKRTGRDANQVIDAAIAGMRRAQWDGASGADADHLKTTADVDVTAAAGFTFFTIDPSDFVEPHADDFDEPALRDRFEALRATIEWTDSYVNQRLPLAGGRSFTIDEQAAVRCTVKYGRALEHAIELAKHILEVAARQDRPVELELSIDETAQPTSLAEHYIIADQCRRRGVPLVSLAPRLVGEFEKGVDYKGDYAKLRHSLADHAALARELGPYKLSLHSGSDKLSLYGMFAEATDGRFHVKTAGTSYLEALRVAAKHDESLFRQVIELSRQYYNRDKATYHVSADVEKLPSAAEVSDVSKLESIYLGRWADVSPGKGLTQPGRQVLHCTFGTVLMDAHLGPAIHALLQSHHDTYTELLADHFSRHLRALQPASQVAS